MLTIDKNNLITHALKEQAEIQEKEKDWYTSCLDILSDQGSMMAGFGASYLLSMEFDESVTMVEFVPFLILSTLSFGLYLMVSVNSIFSVMWGTGLALKGPEGAKSVTTAVQNLKKDHHQNFGYFTCGLLFIFAANIAMACVAFNGIYTIITVSILLFFGILMLFFFVALVDSLRVQDVSKPEARVDLLSAYENVEDIDARLHKQQYQNSEVLQNIQNFDINERMHLRSEYVTEYNSKGVVRESLEKVGEVLSHFVDSVVHPMFNLDISNNQKMAEASSNNDISNPNESLRQPLSYPADISQAPVYTLPIPQPAFY